MINSNVIFHENQKALNMWSVTVDNPLKRAASFAKQSSPNIIRYSYGKILRTVMITIAEGEHNIKFGLQKKHEIILEPVQRCL